MLNIIILFFLENMLVTAFIPALVVGQGIITSLFYEKQEFYRQVPVPANANMETGENQQVVLTLWREDHHGLIFKNRRFKSTCNG